MEAALSDQRLFNTLIQEHMMSSKGAKAMMIEWKLVHDPQLVANGSYYERLATPASSPEWNDNFLQLQSHL